MKKTRLILTASLALLSTLLLASAASAGGCFTQAFRECHNRYQFDASCSSGVALLGWAFERTDGSYDVISNPTPQQVAHQFLGTGPFLAKLTVLHLHWPWTVEEITQCVDASCGVGGSPGCYPGFASLEQLIEPLLGESTEEATSVASCGSEETPAVLVAPWEETAG